MVSTYLTFDLVNRDLGRSLKQISRQQVVVNDTKYYQENIGKVQNVDEFLDDYRLYSYAMKAHGLEEMIYAKAFMKQVLESDLGDDNSFANRLTDDRYKNIAAAFGFGSSSTEGATAQSSGQMERLLDTYDQTIVARNNQTEEGVRYFKAMMETAGKVKSVDEFLQNERLRQFVFDAYGLDGEYYDYKAIRGVLVSDPDDPQSPYQQAYGGRTDAYSKAMKALAEVFDFNADGTVPQEGALRPEKLDTVIEAYFSKQTHLTHAEAVFNQEIFEETIAGVTDIDALLSDKRMIDYIKVAFNLNKVTVVSATIRNVLTSDPDDPNNYINTFGKENEAAFRLLRKAFNFNSDGTVVAGEAQTGAQTERTRSQYMSRWDDKQDEQHAKDIRFYKLEIPAIKKLNDFLHKDAKTSYEFALEAVGIDPDSISKFKVKKALTSDLSDPGSYIYQLKDERLLKLAKFFNFNEKGEVTTQVMAQSNTAITNTAKDYILRQTRFLEGPELEAARAKADEDARYYTGTMRKIETRDQLLEDRKLLDILLISRGIDPETITNDFLKQAFHSDLDDPESFVNIQADKRFAQIVGAFNFDAKGDIDRSSAGSVQNGGEIAATTENYVQQLLETQQGEENPGVRLALYFQRMADTITDPYVILGDEALMEFFRITFQLPAEIGGMAVDAQAKLVENKLNLEDLGDPEKLRKLIERFTVMYDLENGFANTPSPVDILSGGSAGISSETLWALSQVRSGY